MKRLSTLAILLSVLCCAYTRAHAYTMTFDDEQFNYWQRYGAFFAGGFYAADHSASSWGTPHSGACVLRYSWDPVDSPGVLKFMYCPVGPMYTVYSLGAYFSTQEGAVVRMEGRRTGVTDPISSVLIGAAGQSWSNVYAEVSSPTAQIDYLMFYPVSTPDALTRFCADDMTVVPVPEPSSLLALAGGLGALGLPFIRRRR